MCSSDLREDPLLPRPQYLSLPNDRAGRPRPQAGGGRAGGRGAPGSPSQHPEHHCGPCVLHWHHDSRFVSHPRQQQTFCRGHRSANVPFFSLDSRLACSLARSLSDSCFFSDICSRSGHHNPSGYFSISCIILSIVRSRSPGNDHDRLCPSSPQHR